MSDPVVGEVVGVLSEALRELARAGHAQQANRLAGQAWSRVRTADPDSADRINRLMHQLSRLEAAQEAGDS